MAYRTGTTTLGRTTPITAPTPLPSFYSKLNVWSAARGESLAHDEDVSETTNYGSFGGVLSAPVGQEPTFNSEDATPTNGLPYFEHRPAGGVSRYLEMAIADQTGAECKLLFVVCMNDSASINNVAVGLGHNGNGSDAMCAYQNTGNARLRIDNRAPFVGGAYTNDEWHIIVFRATAAGTTAWVDGNTTVIGGDPVTFADALDSFHFGKRPPDATTNFLPHEGGLAECGAIFGDDVDVPSATEVGEWLEGIYGVMPQAVGA